MPIPKVTARCWLENAISRLSGGDGEYFVDHSRTVEELKCVLAYVKASRAPKRRRKDANPK